MRYVIERYGGFAGVKKRRIFEAGTLDGTEQELLDRMLEGQVMSSPRSRGADQFTYKIVREDGLERREAEVPDLDVLGNLLRR